MLASSQSLRRAGGSEVRKMWKALAASGMLPSGGGKCRTNLGNLKCRLFDFLLFHWSFSRYVLEVCGVEMEPQFSCSAQNPGGESKVKLMEKEREELLGPSGFSYYCGLVPFVSYKLQENVWWTKVAMLPHAGVVLDTAHLYIHNLESFSLPTVYFCLYWSWLLLGAFFEQFLHPQSFSQVPRFPFFSATCSLFWSTCPINILYLFIYIY